MSRLSIGLKKDKNKMNTNSSEKLIGDPESGVNSSIFGTASQPRKFEDELFRQNGDES